MKLFVLLLVAICLCSQESKVIPLTAAQTGELSKLQAEYDKANAASIKALDRLRAAKDAIKKTYKVKETGGLVVGLSQVIEATSHGPIVTTGPISYWEFYKTYKYLVWSH